MSKGILYVMSGPSGTGKGTICSELLKTEDIFLSVSSTTREIRSGEIDGVTYNYTTVPNFEKMIANGEMLEYAKYNGNYYGTPKKTIEKMLNEGKDVLLEIEAQGAMQVKKEFPEAVLIFIVPPSMKELKRRLEERGREDAQQISERLETARWELAQAELYNRIIVNDDLDKCVRTVADYLKRKSAERNKAKELLNEIY